MGYISQKKILLHLGLVSLNSTVWNQIQFRLLVKWNSLSIIKFAGRVVLPFVPLAISFQDVNYYVDTPVVITILLKVKI